MLTRCALLIAMSYVVSVVANVAPACTAASGPKTVVVLELYTSEGCNSCPPADKWLSTLPAAGFTADKLIPLAFHVDYWDYIGWKDRFASPDYSRRQREMLAFAHARVVYTPQLILGGRTFEAGRSNRLLTDAVTAINQIPVRAAIHLRLENSRAREWKLFVEVLT